MVHKGDLLDDSEEDDLGPEYEKVVSADVATALRAAMQSHDGGSEGL